MKITIILRLKYILAIFILITLAQYAEAVNQDTSASKHIYFFNGRSVKSILLDSTNNSGLKLSISSAVTKNLQSTVAGKFSADSIDELFDKFAQLYGFEWFKYSGTVYITSKEIETRTITVDSAVISSVMQYLTELNIINTKFPISVAPGDNRIIISGPISYIELVIKKIKQLGLRNNQEQFMIFRLKYASAIDTTYFINSQSAVVNNTVTSNQTVIVPGVATILTGLLNKSKRDSTPVTSKINDSSQSGGESNSSINAKSFSPAIQADERTNSVLIRDNMLNYQLYKNLIKSLDVPTPLIQIDVYMILVNQNKLNTFGVSWAASTNGISAGYNTASIQDALVRISSGATSPLTNQAVLTNVSGFLVGLNFLASNGILKQVSQPSLVTTDSLPAIMSSNEIIYLPMTVNQTSNNSQAPGVAVANNGVSQILTTRSLLIIPHVIPPSSHEPQKIQLTINLQDGNFSAVQANSGSAGLLQSNINTQVVLVNGEALLMAGDTRAASETEVSQVPVLSDIPLLGWLFKSKRVIEYNRRSFYLVIPKVLDVGKFNSNKSVVSGVLTKQLMTPDQTKELIHAGVPISTQLVNESALDALITQLLNESSD